MGWTPLLILFIVLACLLILAIIALAIVYVRIDLKRGKLLKGNLILHLLVSDEAFDRCFINI
ncbi:unnamed protein product [Anisakis simplex]|uniref:Uncharacterized protein n=1 Tax=Anisakis simplex TaxID=6269 RepID=A0A0M3JNF0_ANISI|nr:unnamed protein product [Anisakis simplex]